MPLFQNACMWYSRCASKHMALVGGAAIGLRYWLGDLGVQCFSEEPFDVRRSITFFTFGAFYGGVPGHIIYNTIYARSFFTSKPLLTAMFDVTVQCPLLYYPLFYMAQETVYTPINEFISGN